MIMMFHFVVNQRKLTSSKLLDDKPSCSRWKSFSNAQFYKNMKFLNVFVTMPMPTKLSIPRFTGSLDLRGLYSFPIQLNSCVNCHTPIYRPPWFTGPYCFCPRGLVNRGFIVFEYLIRWPQLKIKLSPLHQQSASDIRDVLATWISVD